LGKKDASCRRPRRSTQDSKILCDWHLWKRLLVHFPLARKLRGLGGDFCIVGSIRRLAG
jgi:hypothetical protein